MCGQTGAGGWCYVGGGGNKAYNKSSSDAYGEKFIAGDVVGVSLDFDRKTIEFFRNGKSQGVAFDNLKGPVYACISSCADNTKLTYLPPRRKVTKELLEKESDVHQSVWIERNRTANLSNTSVEWFSNNFNDFGLGGVPKIPCSQETYPPAGEIDAFLNQFLWVLLRCCASGPVRKSLTTPMWARLILSLTDRSASKIRQLLAIRIARHVLPLLNPTDVNGALKGEGSQLLTSFLDRIGEGTLRVQSTHTEDRDSPADTASSVESELISLVRVLLRSPLWESLTASLLLSHLEKVSSVPSSLQTILKACTEKKEDFSVNASVVDSTQRTSLQRIFAAVSCFGGHQEPQREGSTVLCEVDGEVTPGTLMKISEDQKAGLSLLVHLESGQDIVVKSWSDLSVVSSVNLPLASIKEKQKVIDFFGAYLTLTLGKKEQKEDSKEEKKLELVPSTEVVVAPSPRLELLLVQLSRQILKALNTLLQDPAFVSAFIAKGLAPLLGEKALNSIRCPPDLEQISVPNLEGLSLALSLQQEKVRLQKKAAEWLFLPLPADNEGLYAGDEEGILYYLGSQRYTAPWKNPVDLGLIGVASSSKQGDSADFKAIAGRTALRVLTTPEEKSFFTVDMKNVRVRPTHYSLRHYLSADLEALRSWQFLGSNDGTNFTVIMKHENDEALKTKGQWHVWEVRCDSFYRYFRVAMTSKNSNNQWYLACSGFELYGSLFDDGQIVKRPKNNLKASQSAEEKEREKKKKKKQVKDIVRPFFEPSQSFVCLSVCVCVCLCVCMCMCVCVCVCVCLHRLWRFFVN
jgi:hypothetical protein